MSSSCAVLIVDDEPLARQRIRRFLDERADVEVIGECAGGRIAVEAIVALEPALVLLDIRMPDLDGFGVIAALGSTRLPSIVFITAYQEYAIRAFEVNACDYLLKPFDRVRFHQAVDRALIRAKDHATDDARLRALVRVVRARAGQHARAEPPVAEPLVHTHVHADISRAPASVVPVRDVGGGGYAHRLVVRTGGRIRLVQTADVEVFEASDNYVIVHTAAGDHRMRSTLQELAERLDPARFVRVHRSFIVNGAAVSEIEPWVAGDAVLVMRSGRRVRLSRTHRAALDRLTRIDHVTQRAPIADASPARE